MIRIGWFSPISQKTGIATYSEKVLSAMRAQYPREELDIVVFHPPVAAAEKVHMPYPTITLSQDLLDSDFSALFDVAVYHLGNNSINHAPIYEALMQHPGLVVLHDHVYQHYLAGESLRDNHIGSSFVTLVQNADPGGFQMLRASGTMRCDKGKVSFSPWEGEWATKVPLSTHFANIGLGAIVHSQYAGHGLDSGAGDGLASEVKVLFMPRPDVEDVALPDVGPDVGGPRIAIACCGHIGATKGLMQLINCFIVSPELCSRFHVTIAGFASDPNFLGALYKTIREAQLGDVFEIIVDPPEDDYLEVMAQSDIFYNLRYPNTEGASLSLMEQLAYGRPVIAYRTGSFAEFPDAACYFLDNPGDNKALNALLLEIAANPGDIHAKGVAARAAVQDKTAEQYARQFVEHVHSQLPVLRRRSALTHARAQGHLPEAGPDKDWLSALMASRNELRDFHAMRLLLPKSFAGMSARQKGDFLAANILNIQIDAATARKIGAELEALPPVDLQYIFGRFLALVVHAKHLKPFPQHAILPITDLHIWRILALLPCPAAGFLVRRALEGAAPREDVRQVCDLIQAIGFKGAVRQLVKLEDQPEHSLFAGTPLEAYLDTVTLEDIEALASVRVDENLLALPFGQATTAQFIKRGFYNSEPIGIWASAPQATLYLNNPQDQVLTSADGAVSLLSTVVVDKPQTITVTIEELSSGRQQSCQVDYPPGEVECLDWELELPEFCGPLKVVFETDKLYSPIDYGLSEDLRALGVLVQSLRLRLEPKQELEPEPELDD